MSIFPFFLWGLATELAKGGDRRRLRNASLAHTLVSIIIICFFVLLRFYFLLVGVACGGCDADCCSCHFINRSSRRRREVWMLYYSSFFSVLQMLRDHGSRKRDWLVSSHHHLALSISPLVLLTLLSVDVSILFQFLHPMQQQQHQQQE